MGDTTHVGAVGVLVARHLAVEAHDPRMSGGLGPVLATAGSETVGRLVTRLVAVVADEHVGWLADWLVGSCCLLLGCLRGRCDTVVSAFLAH